VLLVALRACPSLRGAPPPPLPPPMPLLLLQPFPPPPRGEFLPVRASRCSSWMSLT
ncbi:unnamed protein product, partial [Closterium sp. NIES-54]